MSEPEEKDSTLEFSLNFRMKPEDFPRLIGALTIVSVDEIHVGQGEFDFIAQAEIEELQHTVALSTVRRFYSARYNDDVPKPIATKVFNTVASMVGEEECSRDKKGRCISIDRLAWDRVVHEIKQGEREIQWRPRTKTRRFVDAFTNYLPNPIESSKE